MRELPSTEWLREFRRKLHEKAKAEPKSRFYSLYDKTYRMEVLVEAYRKAKANGGASGVDGEELVLEFHDRSVQSQQPPKPAILPDRYIVSIPDLATAS